MVVGVSEESLHHYRHHHIVDRKQQHRLKVRTEKLKLKVKMQSVSDDDVLRRVLEKPLV